MYRPRRTAELGDNQPGPGPSASSSKSTRVSRIAHPVRRTTTNRERSMERASSADRLSSANNFLQAPSAQKRQRSNSANRTPQQKLGAKLPATVEKQRAPLTDKKWTQEQIHKIVDYLKDANIDLGKDFFSRGELKSMSTKDFIAIVNHFFKFIMGNRPKIGKDYVEDIVKILDQIEYPFTVAKSWLKTPNAPHSLNNVVLLLSWLLQFKVHATDIASFEREYSEVSEEFPDIETQLKFLEVAPKAFDMWNNKLEEECEILKTNTIEELIFKKTGLKSLQALDEKVQRLNRKIDNLNSERVVIKDEEKYEKMVKELSIKKKRLDVLEKNSQELERQLSNLNEIAETELKRTHDIQNRVSEIKETIRTQKASLSDRDKLIEEVSHLNHFLETKKQSNFDLQEMGHTNQITLSRLKKKNTEIIAKFNHCLNQIANEFDHLQIDVQNCYLNENSDKDFDEQIENAIQLLHDIEKENCEGIQEYKKEINEIEKKIKMETYEIDNIAMPKVRDMHQKIKETEIRMEQFDLKILNVQSVTLKELDNLAGKCKILEERNAQLNLTLRTNSEEVTTLQQQNEYMMTRLSEKMDEVFAYQEKRAKLVGGAVDALRKRIDEYSLKWRGKVLGQM